MNKRPIFIWNCLIVVTILVLISPQKVSAAPGNDQPRVMVTGYEIENGGVSQGKANQLTITLKNMNQEYAVYSVLVTCVSASKEVFAEYGTSNQAYVESILPNGEKQVVISLEATDTLQIENIDCKLNISFKDDNRGTSSTEMLINLPVKKDHLKIHRTYVPQTAVIDEKSRMSVTFSNVENEEIYNTVMTVKGSSMEDTVVELGTILSGNMKNQEVFITLNTLGEQEVQVEISYDDAKGIRFTSETQSYSINVQEKVESTQIEEVVIEESKWFNLVSIKQEGYIAALVLCAVGILVLLKREKNAKTI